MANAISIECPEGMDPGSFRVNLLASQDDASFLFTSPDVDITALDFQGTEGILGALRAGYEIGVTLIDVQQGDIIVVSTLGQVPRGLFGLATDVVVETSIYKFEDGSWVDLDNCGLRLA